MGPAFLGWLSAAVQVKELRESRQQYFKIKREFDPGSESTLAARLTHASRARKGAILSTAAYG